MIPELRRRFNAGYTPDRYTWLLRNLEERCGTRVEFRIAETPVFLPQDLVEAMAAAGAELTESLLRNHACLAAARLAIPVGYTAAGETAHPHFVTADFALVRSGNGELAPRLVEIQAFPSVYGYQQVLTTAYRQAYGLPESLWSFLGGLDEGGYWALLAKIVLGGHDPVNVVLTELDPEHQKTLPDFLVTARRLGIAVVDIRSLVAVGDKLHYRDGAGRLVPIHRIYNRAIADELLAREVELPFDWTHAWDVEWAGHPNWYFLISKFSLPWLSAPPAPHPAVPAAVFLSDFLEGTGRAQLVAAAVPVPSQAGPQTTYEELLLKPLFSFAGKGIQFAPTQADLEAIPAAKRGEFLLQQRMRFEYTIETPSGLTQAEIRILYLWPDGGSLTPALCLVRLGRGRMMGVDHNKNQEWVGASAAFFPQDPKESTREGNW
ncbi:MAG: hypothetical protein P4L26_06095 [Terracidiphilus sp.]|nr:hypothetical protein [Terracidiphilus sp.]